MTEPAGQSTLVALLLTNRLATVGAKPYTASEFWALIENCERLDDLLTADVVAIVSIAHVDEPEAVRIRTLLDASRAFAFERERLADNGVTLVSAIDPTFPRTLVERLGTGCPAFLLVAGPISSLSGDGLVVTGSGTTSEDLLEVARDAARAAVEHDWSVVTGLSTGVEAAAIEAAGAAGGRCAGVPAEGINVVSRRSDVRRLVHDGQLCVASPYAPDARSSTAALTGRNKIIHALSRVTFVVCSDKGKGAAWSGAVEALDVGSSPVAVWTGVGAPGGNAALTQRGAHSINRVHQLFEPLAVTPTDDSQTALF